MAEHRIYKDKFDINTQNTKDFYNARAKRANEMEYPYTAVLLGDSSPKCGEEKNLYDREILLPLLQINSDSTVLDIGCGMGRWAENIIPDSKYYCGADFSCEMIKLAKERCVFPDRDFDFITTSFQDLVLDPEPSHKHKFNRVIIVGVFMYINDGDLLLCMEKLNDMLEEHCIVLVKEPIAVEQRLTLNEFESQALKSTYDAIYRTRDEYLAIFKPLIDKGFNIKYDSMLNTVEHEEKFSETARWYIILER